MGKKKIGEQVCEAHWEMTQAALLLHAISGDVASSGNR